MWQSNSPAVKLAAQLVKRRRKFLGRSVEPRGLRMDSSTRWTGALKSSNPSGIGSGEFASFFISQHEERRGRSLCRVCCLSREPANAGVHPHIRQQHARISMHGLESSTKQADLKGASPIWGVAMQTASGALLAAFTRHLTNVEQIRPAYKDAVLNWAP